MARPGRRWSTGPSPATVRTVQPRSPKHPRPRGGHHRHAVVTPEAERHEGDGRARRHATDASRSSPTERAPDPRGGVARRRSAGGFCVPNPTTYPWQWLWDSCFHAVVWAHLGDERAPRRARAARSSAQDDDGFVPHLRYGAGPYPHAALWGATGRVHDHPAADVRPRGRRARRGSGCAPDDELVERARRAGCGSCCSRRRRTAGGLVELCHPWESGCDDSPRWDDVVPGGRTPRGVVRPEGRAGRARSSGRPAGRRSTTRRSRSARSASAPWWRGTRSSWRASRATTPCAGRPTSWRRPSTPGGTPSCATWVDDGPTADGLGPASARSTPCSRCSCARVRRRSPRSPIPRAFGARLRAPRRPPRRAHLRADHLLARARPGRSSPTCSGCATSSVYDRTASASLSRSMVTGRERPGSPSTGRPTPGAPLGAVPQTWSTLVVARPCRRRVGRRDDRGLAASAPPAQLAHGIADAEHDDQVAERHDLVGERDGEHVAEHRERVRSPSRGAGGR